MAEAFDTQLIEHYVRLVIRQRWLIVAPLCIALVVGIYLAITLPRVYKSETLILVEAQRVTEGYVKELVSMDINSRISTISQQILSRTNLEKIIKQFQLFTDPRFDNMYMEDKIESLRRNISVNVTRARQGADAFAISYKGTVPEKVKNIANTLATFFIDENLKLREAQAIGTSSFLDDELITVRKRLESLEEALKAYRKRYMGELPEQLETNLRILDRLQEENSGKEESLRSAKNRLADFDNMIQAIKRGAKSAQSMDSMGVIEDVPEDVQQLEALKKQLSMVQSRYTDRHPDIIKLKRIIENLEQKILSDADGQQAVESSAGQSSSGATAVTFGMDPRVMSQRDAIRREIDTLNVETTELQEQIKVYEARVENAPKREQELLSLKRDYENIQSQYNSLLNRKLEAEIAVNMERKQKGEQFRILDPARLPEKPIEPDMNMLFLLTIAVGLGSGGGLIFLLDFLNTSFKSPGEVEKALGVPVLARIPSILQPKDFMRRRINLALSAVSIAFTLALFAGFAVLIFHGVDQTVAFVGKFVPFKIG